MTVEATIFTTLKTLVNNRVYPDVAPVGTLRPYITYQQVGGPSTNFLDGSDPGKSLPRFQINVWGDTRTQVKALALQVQAALRAVTALQPTVEGEPVSIYEESTGLRGSMQDFSFIA